MRSYGQQPESVPVHFGIFGEPDSWACKWTILISPAISIVLYAGMTILGRYPHLYNYPWPVTPENAAAQYQLTRSLLIWVKAEITCLFAYIYYQTVQVPIGLAAGLGVFFAPTMFAVLVGTIGIYFYRAHQSRQATLSIETKRDMQLTKGERILDL